MFVAGLCMGMVLGIILYAMIAGGNGGRHV